MSLRAVDPSWLLAAAADRLLAVRGTTEVEVVIDGADASARQIAALLAAGTTVAGLAAVAGVALEDSAGLLTAFGERGALAEPGGPPGPEPESGLPLAEAIVRALRSEPVTAAWTADEALVLPAGAGAQLTRRALRAFTSGLRPGARLRAYAEVARTGDSSLVHGDRPPDAELVDERIAAARAAGPEAVHVVDADGRTSTPADDIARLGFTAPHRLGPLLAVERAAGPHGGGCATRALHAAPSLRHPQPEAARTTHGLGEDDAHAELVARAEAAERFALGDVTGVELVRATAAELAGAVAPQALLSRSARQRAALGLPDPGPGDPLLWVRAATLDGAPRWVPAAAVLSPFDDPAGPPLRGASSSGAAAHTSRAAAIERGLLELVERDAFMWTWIQRVSRELIDPASLPAAAAQRAAALAGAGHRVDLVNLTLDSAPTVLCVLRGPAGLLLAAAARGDAIAACERALAEAGLLAASIAGRPTRTVAPEAVLDPEDHLDLYRSDDGAAAFLTASADVISITEIAGAPGALDEALEAVGEPLVVDLTVPATAPFQVVRVLVPGLVPLTFGFDREPLGLPRLGRPIAAVDGRSLGRVLDLESAAPVAPHPFA